MHAVPDRRLYVASLLLDARDDRREPKRRCSCGAYNCLDHLTQERPYAAQVDAEWRRRLAQFGPDGAIRSG